MSGEARSRNKGGRKLRLRGHKQESNLKGSRTCWRAKPGPREQEPRRTSGQCKHFSARSPAAMKPLLSLAFSLLVVLLCFHHSGFTAAAWAGAQNQLQTRSTDVSASPAKPGMVHIPGPLRSFLRMAAISQKSTPEQVLPFLSRNVVVEGY